MTDDELKAMDEFAKRLPAPVRKWVDLEPGEAAPPTHRPCPEGTRWETDDEFRTRLKALAGGQS